MTDAIRIAGLREFTRGLKRFDADLPKGVRIANNKAADIIVRAAVRDIPFGPGRGGHARDTLKARSTRTEVRIAAGGKKAPYYPWLDFGGRVGKNRSVRRPFIKEGRYIFPALKANRQEMLRAHEEALTDLAREAGLV